MPWVFSIESIPDTNPSTGVYEPHGVRVVKTFYSDSGEPVVAVDSDATEAISESAAAGLYEEYVSEARSAFKSQIDLIFDMVSSGTLVMNSIGSVLGAKISKAVVEAKAFKEDIN